MFGFSNAPSISQNIFKQFFNQFESYEQSVGELKSNLSQKSEAEIIDDYLELRVQFKSIESLLAYYMEGEYNLYFNGAPLPKLEPNAPQIVVLEPKGMQVLDELIYADSMDKKEIEKILHELSTACQFTKKILRSITAQDRHIIEALRSQIVRTVSLGLSGFDTPGSAAFMLDAITINQVMIQYLTAYQELMRPEDKIIQSRLSELAQALDNNKDLPVADFAHLIREYYNPLYGDILRFHLGSGIEHAREVSNILSPLNYYAESIFDEDFLNLAPFNKIDPSDYTPAKIKLGESLFYDDLLSQAKDMSCATCHQPEKGFADGKKISVENSSNRDLQRNTPTLINSIYSRRYFYDMRAVKPDLQIDHVVYNPDEFHFNYDSIASRLHNDEKYKSLFEKNYGENHINRYTITDAITQYISSLSGFSSPFDEYMRKESDAYAPEAIAGFNLFMSKGACASCHFVPLFNGTVPPAYQDSESEILGVLATNDFINPRLDTDPGRIHNGNATEASEIYHRSFKTPSVRNIALTAPYMHNGVHPTLDDVMTFYNNGGGAGMKLDVPYQTLAPDSLGLTTEETKHIITFMETLTDTIGMIPILE